MDYKWVRDFSLELINQYSIAGGEIAASYNNQADYLRRIPKLVDDAQLLLATNEGRMRTVVPLSELEKESRWEWDVYTLPEDCWQICPGLVRLDRPGREGRYRMLGDRLLEVWTPPGGRLALEYYRYPKLLGTDPAEDAELDNTLQAQQTIPYYVAAHLVMQDNAFAYQALFNEFEQKRALLREPVRCEWGVTEDAYGGAW